jgi:hypothetical protein
MRNHIVASEGEKEKEITRRGRELSRVLDNTVALEYHFGNETIAWPLFP